MFLYLSACLFVCLSVTERLLKQTGMQSTVLYVHVGHKIRYNRNVLLVKIWKEKLTQTNQGIAGKKDSRFTSIGISLPKCDVLIKDEQELLFLRTSSDTPYPSGACLAIYLSGTDTS